MDQQQFELQDLPESKVWRGYRWKITERERFLVLRDGNPKPSFFDQ